MMPNSTKRGLSIFGNTPEDHEYSKEYKAVGDAFPPLIKEYPGPFHLTDEDFVHCI